MYIADLHIHSRYSRATSKDGTTQMLDYWASRKGIHLVGTGDFTHPAWRQELRDTLVPAKEQGLYQLKEELRLPQDALGASKPRFVISGEISSIYKKNGKVRKVHSLILLPSLEAAEQLSRRLELIGNLHSDGRPILGLDCRDLLEITLETCPEAIYIPAHIWTPHFSLFGAFSGFDTVEECFEDLSGEIHAMETGLSSNPPMNWRLSALDSYQLVSNSDAHSPSKLGREANLLEIELSYPGLYSAIQEGKGLAGTIEFFPEEGKYHYDGHRKCHVCLSPQEAERYHGICPVCGKKLTIGVDHRVLQLADREEGAVSPNARPFESLAPLPEVIAASLGRSSASAFVQNQYDEMLGSLGTEFAILRQIPVEEIRRQAGARIAQGIWRLRQGKAELIPGFDGEYGSVQLFWPWELEEIDGQMNLFESLGLEPEKEMHQTQEVSLAVQKKEQPTDRQETKRSLNSKQLQAVQSAALRLAVLAGPGTGKTHTLVARILYLIQNRRVPASSIRAVTFTNQAAGELSSRLCAQLGSKAKKVQTGTFHSLCMKILQEEGMEFVLTDHTSALELAEEIRGQLDTRQGAKKLLDLISRKKTGLPIDSEDEGLAEQALELYETRMEAMGALDFDDLLLKALALANEGKGEAKYLLVDEFQDISPLQYELIRQWSRNGRELFVIGDPDQAIYGFRGADAGCFQQFCQEKETQVIRLEENYRSTPQIVRLAGQVIRPDLPQQWLIPQNPQGPVPRILEAGSDLAQGIFVAKEISRMVGGIDMLQAQEGRGEEKSRGFGDIGILYRTHRQAKLLEQCLQKEGIPYVVAGREGFLEAESVRGTIGFFRSLENPQDLLAYGAAVRLAQGHSLDLKDLEDKYRSGSKNKRPEKILAQWMEDTGLSQDPDMEKFLSMACFYKHMSEFLEALSFGRESDLKRCSGKKYSSDAVTLMTLHGSKGLEFPVVFLWGCSRGTIPLERPGSRTDLEEERRLFYVGATRAKEELIVSYTREPSCFLENLKDFAEFEEIRKDAGQDPAPEQMSIFDFIR